MIRKILKSAPEAPKPIDFRVLGKWAGKPGVARIGRSRTACILLAAPILAAPLLGSFCNAVTGDKIFGRDLKNAYSSFGDVADDAVIAFAPQPGAQRILTSRDLMRAGIQATGPDVCFERRAYALSPSQLEPVLKAALDRPNASLEILDYARSALPTGKLEFLVTGLPRPYKPDDPVLWRGRLRLDEVRTLPVWVRVRITEPGVWVESAGVLSPGQPITATQLQLREGRRFPFGPPVSTALEELVGLRPRRSIPAGQPITRSMFEEPPLISRNEVVEVEVLSGPVSLRFDGRADANGRAGDSILVLDPAKNKRFKARVAGKGKVIIDANRTHSDGQLPASAHVAGGRE